MERSSLKLNPVVSHPHGLPVYFLTGKKYIYQTLFCIQSLTKATSKPFRFVLVDDGSFDAKLIKHINRLLPGAKVIDASVINKNLESKLPKAAFQQLHQKREVYPHIKKLTDIHTITEDPWKLVLDSDMLFWNEPAEIINWLMAPDKPLHMVDCEQSYGYSVSLMESLCCTSVKPLVNVGAIGLNSDHINWRNIQHWVKLLEEKEGTSYYLEQAITAMLIGDVNAVELDSSRYIVSPDKTAIEHKNGTLHHYVDLSKEGYYKTAWESLV